MADPAGSFSQLLLTLEQQDFFIGVLPFILTYVIFYLSLDQIPLFDDNERMSRIVAVIAGFFVSYFMINNPVYQQFFVEYFGSLTVGLLGILGLFILLGMTGMPGEYFSKNAFALLAVIIVAAAFTVSGGFSAFGMTQTGIMGMAAHYLDRALNSGLIWVAVIIGAVIYASGGGRDTEEISPLNRLLSWATQHPPDERHE